MDYNNEIEKMKKLCNYGLVKESKFKPSTKNSTIEYQTQAADGKHYAIVKECKNYYIKYSEPRNNMVTENFEYIGGISNKKNNCFNSYNQAFKQLEMKLKSIRESSESKSQPLVEAYKPQKYGNISESSIKEMSQGLDRMFEIINNAGQIGVRKNGNTNGWLTIKESKQDFINPEYAKDTEVGESYPFTEKPCGSNSCKTASSSYPFEENDVDGLNSIEKTTKKGTKKLTTMKPVVGKGFKMNEDTEYDDEDFDDEIEDEEDEDEGVDFEEDYEVEVDPALPKVNQTKYDRLKDLQTQDPFDGIYNDDYGDDYFDLPESKRGRRLVEEDETTEIELEIDDEIDSVSDMEGDIELEDDFDTDGDDVDGEETFDIELDDEEEDAEDTSEIASELSDIISRLEDMIDDLDSDDFDYEEEDLDLGDEDDDLDLDDEEEDEIELEIDDEEDLDLDDEDDDEFVGESKKNKNLYLVKEDGTVLDVFGSHPGYQKEPMTLPTSNITNKRGVRDGSANSVKSTKPFGTSKGSSFPFEDEVSEITEAIMKGMKKSNVMKKVKKKK